MAPSTFPCAVATLSYPLYACEFDPEDPSVLIIGGGGGSGRNGVGNKISVISIEDKLTIKTVIEQELSSEEDSVVSLAVGIHRAERILVYAGVNSSPADIKNNKNEHFNVFGISEAVKEKGAKIELLTRVNQFPVTDADKYQRLIRLAAPGRESQIAAAATGLSEKSQIAISELNLTGVLEPKIVKLLNIDNEANDLDIRRIGPNNEHRIVYANDCQLCAYDFTPGTNTLTKHNIVFENRQHGVFPGTIRCLRYLTPTFVLIMANLPKRGGVALNVVRLPSKEGELGRIAASARLPKHVAHATALSVRLLGDEPEPGEILGRAQFAIAVAGHDSSISLYSLGHESEQKIDLVYQLDHMATIKQAHPLQITGLAFAPFRPPNNGDKTTISLASISMGNTLSVHTLPVTKLVSKQGSITKTNFGLDLEKKSGVGGPLIMFISFLVLLTAVVGQILNESLGEGPEIFGVKDWMDHPFLSRTVLSSLPPVISTINSIPTVSTNINVPYATDATDALSQFLANIQAGNIDGPIILKEEVIGVKQAEDGGGAVIAAMAAGEQHKGKTWEDISQEQKEQWKARLKKAGHWDENMGESVFNGIFFSELTHGVRRTVTG